MPREAGVPSLLFQSFKVLKNCGLWEKCISKKVTNEEKPTIPFLLSHESDIVNTINILIGLDELMHTSRTKLMSVEQYEEQSNEVIGDNFSTFA